MSEPKDMMTLAQEFINKHRTGKSKDLLGQPAKRGYLVRPAYIILHYDSPLSKIVDWRETEADADKLVRELYEQEQEAELSGASKKRLPSKKPADAGSGSADMAGKEV